MQRIAQILSVYFPSHLPRGNSATSRISPASPLLCPVASFTGLRECKHRQNNYADQHSFQQLRQLFLVQHALVCVHERVCSSLGVHPAIPPREAQHTDGMGWVSLPVRNLLGEFSPPVHAGPAAPISSAHLGANSQSKQKLDRVRGGGVGSLLLQMFLVLHGAAANQF